jgi:hypothetical protein
MRTFCRADTVKTGKDGKAGSCGITMAFLGYADKDESHCYRMFTPLRNSVVETLDMIWPRRMYYKRVYTNVTELGPIVVIKANNSGDEVVEKVCQD